MGIKTAYMLKRILFFIFLSFSSYVMSSQSSQYLIHLDSAKTLFKSRRYQESKEYYQLLIKSPWVKRVDFYFLASCFANLNQLDSAYLYMNQALELGLKFNDTVFIKRDQNLLKFKDSKYWNYLYSRFVQNSISVAKINNNLKNELIKRSLLDQKHRGSLHVDSITWLEQKKIDLENQIWLDSIINIYGWPSISLVGDTASRLAWMIVQHADNNILFQKKCLKLMQKFIKTNDISLLDYAYLYDRIQINSCEEQLYGTQFSTILNEEGNLVSVEFKPIKDSGYLDKRRAYMNLSTIEEYRNKILKRYK